MPVGTRELFLYTPELNLLAETELSASARPQIANEYLWWNGHALAQIDATGVTSWTFTDHLGTPILQTSAQQGIVWWRSTSRSERSMRCGPTTGTSRFGCRGRRRRSWGWGERGDRPELQRASVVSGGVGTVYAGGPYRDTI